MTTKAPSDKVFRDNVHGYITVPKDIVELFIDTAAFQRLRQIEQTGMRVLFPSARHDRFVHSLGTYYLSVKACKNLIKNVKATYGKQNAGKNNFYYFIRANKREAEKYWEKCELLFTIASLLHDCAHAPFSHTLEFLYEYPCEKFSGAQTLREKITALIGNRHFTEQFLKKSAPGAPHELMSSLVVKVDYSDAIKELLIRRGFTFKKGDIEFIVRAITGCKYEKNDIRSQIKDCFISLLNSSYIDVDSLDYIIRDATLSGMDNVSIDVERLLGALTVVEVEKLDGQKLENTKIDADITGRISDLKINANYKGNLHLTDCDGELSGYLDIEGNFKINQPTQFVVPKENDSEYIILVGAASYKNSGQVVANDSNVQSKIKAMTADNQQLSIEGSFQLGNNHNGHVKIKKAKTAEIELAHIKGVLSGKCDLEVIGNKESLGGTKKYRIGYYKSALSIMDNVIIARNYEYKWIYSHHKVVYSANFLLIDLIKECLKYLENEYEETWAKLFHWQTFIETPFCLNSSQLEFYRPSDSDILYLFNYVFNKLKRKQQTEGELYKLLMEFFTRKYRTSVWKSYSEFRQFFDFLTAHQKELLKKIICKHSNCYVKTKGEEYQYGYFDKDWQTELEKLGFYSSVWVNASSKLKSIDVAKTYIQFKDKTLTYEYAIGAESSQIVDPLNFFYLYYRAEPNSKPDYQGLKDFLFTKIKSYNNPRETIANNV